MKETALTGETADKSAAGPGSERRSRFIGRATALLATGRFLRRQLWIWPILAALLLGGARWYVNAEVEGAMRRQRIDALTTILDADVTAVRVWLVEQAIDAELIARDPKLEPPVQELLDAGDRKAGVTSALLSSKAGAEIRSRLSDKLKLVGYSGYFIVSPAGIVLAADQDAPIGKLLTGPRKEFYDRVLSGRPSVSMPFRSPLLLADKHGELKANLPSMFAAAPIRSATGKPIAALGLRIRPEDHFTKILQVARTGLTGETYAFDRSGVFLSQSRFDDQMKQTGLLVDRPDSQSILTLELRDPGANLAKGERPKSLRADQPFTRMAVSALKGESGYDVDGYRDYRGVPVVGAWQWLNDYDFGIATEIDVAEAFRPVYILRRAFWVLLTLLALAALGIYLAMIYMARQQKQLQAATLAARKLGQYTLEDKIGSGGMGTVYKARHAMLRRPTAIKLLNVEKISEAAIARFEREVQLTSSLTHPNTIAIYDYGRTPEGIFYYAMEYLEGTDLDDLVGRFGPLPEARLVHILRQACGSLSEAHARGLVHRDVKPANIFLTCRGGVYDFVKVLDFGLVKATAGPEAVQITAANVVTGTPLFLSPEAVRHPEQVDARSDVYSLGAVGYFLLTGQPVFSGNSVLDICMKHVNAAPEAPSVRRGLPVSSGLEGLLMQCLAKSPAERPGDAAVFLRKLDACVITGAWTAADAASWWKGQEQSPAAADTKYSASFGRAGTPEPTTAATVEYDARVHRPRAKVD
jgi:hypothetical protein